ncbi:MAG: cyanoexosortase A system-associated protein [Cyanosarcina radialis HA8281-LM2]|jgi:cyanosortase A-associated protein|nr:cyanoexosortase A system-associated protein [Cyanosarcina radialis HA8281-LM2]
MKIWQQLRVPILALTLSGAISVLVKSIFFPTAREIPIAPLIFPPDVPLPGWQFFKSQPIDRPLAKNYQYRQQDLLLKIEMNYVTNPHDNEKLFRRYNPAISSPNAPAPIVREQKGIGFYSLSVDRQRAYLRACINPRGGSVITYEQFVQKRYSKDLQLDRFIPWLLGRETLRDHRCLWAHLSVPIQNYSPESAYPALENAWFSWYRWWYPHLSES